MSGRRPAETVGATRSRLLYGGYDDAAYYAYAPALYGYVPAYYALGLTLTRLKQPDAALAELRRASELEPERARYIYVHAVALHSGGHSGKAMTVLKKGLESYPGDRDIPLALVTFSRVAGDADAALD